MDKKEQKNERQEYLDNLMALAEEDCHGAFKEAIKLRLCGNHRESVRTSDHGDIVSPALTSDEYEENQLIIYAYKLLKKANNKRAVDCLREVVVELLKTALSEKNNITYVDELCYLMASLEMEESPKLAENLGKSMWSHLEKFGEFGKLILSDDEELSYIHRTFDVWLTVTSTSQHNAQLQQLFEGNIACVKDVSAMQFKFLLLIFRALVKFDHYFAGNVAFYKLHEKLVLKKNPAYIRSFNNLCWELGILIRRTEGWLEPFIKGLNEAEIFLKSNALKSAIFIDALNRMKLTPSGEIGFVLTFNKIANEIINASSSERWNNKLKLLNGNGVVIALWKRWERYSRLFTSFFTEETLKEFIQQRIFSERLYQKPFNHNCGYTFPEEREFIEFLVKLLKKRHSSPQNEFKITYTSSNDIQICIPCQTNENETSEYICFPYTVTASKEIKMEPESIGNMETTERNAIIIDITKSGNAYNGTTNGQTLPRAA